MFSSKSQWPHWVTLLAILIGLLQQPTAVLAEAMTTGDTVITQTGNTNEVIVVATDYAGPSGDGDVGSPLGKSGWDIEVLTATITSDFQLSLQVRNECIIGDADCNGVPGGQPGATSQGLVDLGGEDVGFTAPGSTASFAFAIGASSTRPDYICGAPAIAESNKTIRCSPALAGAQFTQPHLGFGTTEVPWTYKLHIDGRLAKMSTNLSAIYPNGVPVLYVSYYNGSQQDQGIGEDTLPNTVNSGGRIQIPVPAKVGDRVWDDLNGNGIQDSGEKGIKGVGVTITSGSTAVITTTTDSNGNYSAMVPSGSVCVDFVKPNGYVESPPLQSDYLNDSNGAHSCSAVAPGQTDFSYDYGLYKPAVLGDLVWYDADRDGIQDPSESGVPGVQMTLRHCTGALIAQTPTDANGIYTFTNLIPGGYVVVVDTQYTLTQVDQGSDDAVDSDFDAVNNQSTCTELAPGEVNRKIDTGVLLKTDLLLKKTALSGTIEVSGTVSFVYQIENTGNITATEVVLTDDQDPWLHQIITSSHPYTVDDLEITWFLPDIAPHSVYTVSVVVKPNAATPDGTSAQNRAHVTTMTAETVQLNNYDNADVTILNPEQAHRLCLPIICNQSCGAPNTPGPQPEDVCKVVKAALLHVEYFDRGLQSTVYFTRTISVFENTGLILPGGGDTDYEKGLKLWVTGFQPNTSEGDYIRIVMYEPYYSHVRLAEGERFVLRPGYAGEALRIHIRLVDFQTQPNGTVRCITGTFLDSSVDPLK